ncbi:hypothetical protein HHI36_005197 [Cryptolaemus montrouzieri]|uniref:Uncharacterized protein n=1 Tax=Cryptolaemus montrouzieri TaxID=559131 RepID=A0ABD2NTY0_9CUCU
MFFNVVISPKKKYKYHDIILTVNSTDYYGYHTECLKKVTVLKQKDKDEFEEFCKTQTIPSLPLQECIYEESNSPINCNPDDLNTTTGDQPIITSDEHRISTSVSNEQPTTSSAHDDTQFQSLTSLSSSLTPEKEISSENKNKKPVCLFCDTIEKKVGKKRNYVAFPRSETTVNTIRVMAEKLNDKKLLAKLNSNQSVAYHSNCLSLYQLSVRRHDKERPEPIIMCGFENN